MSEIKAIALSLAALVALGACTETQVVDSLGVGKSSPNEGQVRINQALSMPPDLRLKAPGTQTTEDGSLNRVAKVDTTVERPIVEEVVDEPVSTASTDPAATAKPVQTAEAGATATTTTPTPTTTGQVPPPTKEDAYKRYGISTTYPDGKPKPEGVLNDELRKAQTAAKRAADPKYGTIWNMGDMFSDD
jgi:hypothetical protein